MVLEVSALCGPMALAMAVASLASTLSAGGAASDPYRDVGSTRAITIRILLSLAQGWRASLAQMSMALLLRWLSVVPTSRHHMQSCPPRSLAEERTLTLAPMRAPNLPLNKSRVVAHELNKNHVVAEFFAPKVCRYPKVAW